MERVLQGVVLTPTPAMVKGAFIAPHSHKFWIVSYKILTNLWVKKMLFFVIFIV